MISILLNLEENKLDARRAINILPLRGCFPLLKCYAPSRRAV